MKVAGFTFIRNAILFDFPVVESIKSILPICDVVYVAVGESADDTRKLIENIDPDKLIIIDTVWDNALNKNGLVLADETNKAFQAIDKIYDWCFYIQGDEIFHEEGTVEVLRMMKKYNENQEVEGLLFKYKHFYGSYDYVGTSSKWYKNEIRIIKNNKSIYSYRDAQGFRKGDNEKLKVVPIDAFIHHYGWVKDPETMNAKINNTKFLWGGEGYDKEKLLKVFEGEFNYLNNIDSLEKFTGKHPKIMEDRIKKSNWFFNYDISFNNLPVKEKFKNLIEKVTGKRPFDYKNYKLIK